MASFLIKKIHGATFSLVSFQLCQWNCVPGETTKEENKEWQLCHLCVWGGGVSVGVGSGELLKVKDETHPQLGSRKNQVKLLKPAIVNAALRIQPISTI